VKVTCGRLLWPRFMCRTRKRSRHDARKDPGQSSDASIPRVAVTPESEADPRSPPTSLSEPPQSTWHASPFWAWCDHMPAGRSERPERAVGPATKVETRASTPAPKRGGTARGRTDPSSPLDPSPDSSLGVTGPCQQVVLHHLLVDRSGPIVPHQTSPRSNLFQRNTTGASLNSAMPARMRAFARRPSPPGCDAGRSWPSSRRRTRSG
jgi:hypothetical protein